MTNSHSVKRAWTKPRVQIADVKDLTSGGEGSGLDGGTMIGMAMISDVRLKRDVVPCGIREDGLMLYAFRYIGGGPLLVGVIAQDVLRHTPDAVITDPAGVLRVDYSRLAIEPEIIPA